jgi:hypothetical protein
MEKLSGVHIPPEGLDLGDWLATGVLGMSSPLGPKAWIGQGVVILVPAQKASRQGKFR